MSQVNSLICFYDVHHSSFLTVYFCLFLQILQSIANHVLFTKEEHMRPFNDFVKSNFDSARR